jgi:hypothetical protein
VIRPSPLQNRCAPDGRLCAVAAQGTMMGNRGGRLHRADGTLGAARWRSRAWICCRLDFRGRHRVVMGTGYTEIFFLDEATALAAGHRPCFECRRDAARAFAAAWPRPHGTQPPRAAEMDRILHAVGRTTQAPVAAGTLPSGTIFTADGAFHLAGPPPQLWDFDGYAPARTFAADEPVVPITPPTIRAILAAGYRPTLHPSAGMQVTP